MGIPTDITLSLRASGGRYQSGFVPLPDSLRYAAGHYATEKMPFTLVRPAHSSEGYYDPDFYGYVGREHHIPVIAQGGAFPHSVEIDEAPTGATISNTPWDADYLVLKFTPTANGTSRIRLRLYDAIGKCIIINYLFTVSTAWCVFISPTGNDTTGTGTKAAPWATRAKAFAATTGGKCLILENGTYTETTLGCDFSVSTVKSMISWSPRGAIIDLSSCLLTTPNYVFKTEASHISIQGIIFNNPPNAVQSPRWFTSDQSTRYVYQDNCEFNIDGRTGTVNSDNVSCFFNGGDKFTDRRYIAQTRCKFTGFAGLANGWSSIDTYGTKHLVIRGNKFDDQRSTTTSAGMMWIKALHTRDVDIMLNEFVTTFGGSLIDLMMGNSEFEDNVTGNTHVAFNLIRCTEPSGIWVGRSQHPGTRLPIWTSRNTIIGGVIMVFENTYNLALTSDSDVIQTTASTTDPFKVFIRTAGAYAPLSSMPSLTASVTNYECQKSSGVVDSTGTLIGAYATYDGIRGHKITRGV